MPDRPTAHDRCASPLPQVAPDSRPSSTCGTTSRSRVPQFGTEFQRFCTRFCTRFRIAVERWPIRDNVVGVQESYRQYTRPGVFTRSCSVPHAHGGAVVARKCQYGVIIHILTWRTRSTPDRPVCRGKCTKPRSSVPICYRFRPAASYFVLNSETVPFPLLEL